MKTPKTLTSLLPPFVHPLPGCIAVDASLNRDVQQVARMLRDMHPTTVIPVISAIMAFGLMAPRGWQAKFVNVSARLIAWRKKAASPFEAWQMILAQQPEIVDQVKRATVDHILYGTNTDEPPEGRPQPIGGFSENELQFLVNVISAANAAEVELREERQAQKNIVVPMPKALDQPPM